MKIPFSMTQDSLTVFYQGPKTFLAGTIQYNSLKAAILQEQWDKIPSLLTTAGALSAFLGGSFTLDGDDIAFNGVKLPESIQRRIRAIADEGGDVGPLFRFYERLHKNPSFRSREQLHRFMEHNDIAIENDGTFLAYKGLKDDYTDCHTGTIDNSPGQKHVMDRNLVSDDPETPCHFGFHVGALEYASGFGPVVVICRVDPEHVVCVPKDYSSQKMRTCQYEVVGEWSGQVMDPVADDSDLPGNYDHGGEDDWEHPGNYGHDEEYDVNLEDIDDEIADVVPDHVEPVEPTDSVDMMMQMASMGTKDLMKCSLDTLRKFASNALLIHGASKIPGGKAALVSKIMSVRRRRTRK